MIAQQAQQHARRVAELEKKIVSLSAKFWRLPPLSEAEGEVFQEWQLAVQALTELQEEDAGEEEENPPCAA